MSIYNNNTRTTYDACNIKPEPNNNIIDGIKTIKEPTPILFSGINYGLIANERVLVGELTNQRQEHQLFIRPYYGSYMGAGTATTNPDNIELESALFQGVSTKLRNKTCEPIQGAPLDRFECIPEYGNPQREQYIIPPKICEGGWIRGGADTRDYVRRVDYFRRCAQGKL